MLITFKAALWMLQQSDKHSYSLQLAIHTMLANHYMQYAL